MSAKARTIYRCTNCGADHPKWAGRCDVCGDWNTLVEEVASAPANATGATARRRGGTAALSAGGTVVAAPRLRDVHGSEARRWKTGIGAARRLQVAATLQGREHEVLYVSGEESPLQVKLRADRLGDAAQNVALLSETNLETILATASAQAPAVMIVDSIQTVFTSDLEGAPGNVGQVRESAARLMHFAKASGTSVFLVGHVTKGGGIAGPKTLEHIVDTVLYFEGEGALDHRILRATKNRFGSVDEIGVFRMHENGLEPVANPSELFLSDRHDIASGSAVTTLLEGSRPILIEVQALAAKAGYGTPQRVSTGYDGRKLALLLAVLDKRAGLAFSSLDVFINVVGGVQLREPAGDLAVAAALASSVYDRALPSDAVFIGEVGLGGEIRPVAQTERRLAEAAKMGMRNAFVAQRSAEGRIPKGVRATGVATIGEMFKRLFS